MLFSIEIRTAPLSPYHSKNILFGICKEVSWLVFFFFVFIYKAREVFAQRITVRCICFEIHLDADIGSSGGGGVILTSNLNWSCAFDMIEMIPDI